MHRPATSLLVGVLFLTGCQKQEGFRSQVTPVAVVEVTSFEAAPPQEYTGQIRSRHEFNAAFRVGGKIEQRLVEVGDRVRAGQTLARLDRSDFQLGVEAAESELLAGQANERRAIQEELRIRNLVTQKLVSQSEYDLAKSNAESGRANVSRALKMLEIAQNRLRYCELKADQDSIVLRVLVEAGTVVAEGTPVIQLAQVDALEAVVDIPENKIETARSNRGELSLWANTGKKYRIRLREISPNADPITRTYQVRYAIDGAGDEVRLGMTATVHLAMESSSQAVSIPMSSLREVDGQPSVFVFDRKEQRLIARSVTIQSYGPTFARVASGLQAGELVVRAGVQKLDETMPVRLWDGP